MGFNRKRPASAGAPSSKRFAPSARPRGSAGGFRSAVRKEILRTTETKMMTYSPARQNLNHNVLGGNSAFLFLTKGDEKNHMSGDEVFLNRLQIRMHFNTKPDRSQVMLRIMLVRVPSDKSSIASSSLFESSTNFMIALNNTSECTILKEKVIRLSGTSQYSYGGSHTVVGKDLATTCRIDYNFGNLKTRYDSNYPKNFNLRLLVVAYDAHGTLTSDNIADFEMTSRLYFKDP